MSNGEQTAPKARTYGRATCPECGERFTRSHHRQGFCTPAHKQAFHARTQARGQTITTLVQAWRAARSTRDPLAKKAGKVAFSDLCALADRWNAEDRAAGRVPAPDVVIQQAAMGFRAPLA